MNFRGRRNVNEVTETELAILDVLWEQGPVPVRTIVDELYGEYRRSLHASVKSLLDRLMEKGFVETDTSEYAHRFSAKVDRAQFESDRASVQTV